MLKDMDFRASDADRVPAIIPMEFFKEVEQKDGQFVEVEYVSWIKRGNPGHGLTEKIARIQKHDPAMWEVIGPAYDAWKKGESEPLNGTSLAAWPGVSKKMVAHLKMNGFRTVEDLANSTDGDMQRIGIGSMGLRDKARTFVSLKTGDAQGAEIIEAQNQRIKALEDQLAEALAVIKSPNITPKKRGRPKKEAKDESA